MQLLIFDLDGTLIDSSRDLAISTNAMLRHLGRPEIDPALVNTYVGDGAPKLVRRALGGNAPEEEFESAYEYFIRYYRNHSLENTKLYPGIAESLDSLHHGGAILAVLTNKPVRISSDILRGLSVDRYFNWVYGGDSFPSKKPDPAGIETLIKDSGIAREYTTMVGDSSVDIQTARNARVRSCGVTWGFKPESLKDPAPDLIATDAAHLTEMLPMAKR